MPASRTLAAAVLVAACPALAWANCNSCYLPRVNRDQTYSLGADRAGFFADARLEYQDWKTVTAPSGDADEDDAHPKDQSATHGDGHSHNRSRERYTHLTLGKNWTDGVTVLAHSAYVERFELTDEGIDSVSGVGDTDLVGV